MELQKTGIGSQNDRHSKVPKDHRTGYYRQQFDDGPEGTVINELVCSILGVLSAIKWKHISILVGFVIAWLLFELTERRRIRIAQRELRRALVVELEYAEVLLSSVVGKYARICKSEEDVAYVANEIRWFQQEGRLLFVDAGVFSGPRPDNGELKKLSDKQLVGLFSQIKETVGTAIIMPILEQVLAGQTIGFHAKQIQALSVVRWQTYLFNQEAGFMKEMYLLTFSVDDPDNHKIVQDNHAKHIDGYARRAKTLLRVIREALQVMR